MLLRYIHARAGHLRVAPGLTAARVASARACPDGFQVSPGGGFGPVTDDGYGVSYMVANEDEVRAAAMRTLPGSKPTAADGFRGGASTIVRVCVCAGGGGTRGVPHPTVQVFFHVSSKKSSKVTDAARFSRLIKEALLDLRTIFE